MALCSIDSLLHGLIHSRAQARTILRHFVGYKCYRFESAQRCSVWLPHSITRTYVLASSLNFVSIQPSGSGGVRSDSSESVLFGDYPPTLHVFASEALEATVKRSWQAT